MKQSFWLIVLQIVSIFVGLFTTFYVAGNLTSNIYAVVGIYTVISSVISVFSNSGLETFASRNVLLWNQEGNYEKSKMIITQAIFVRTIIAIILVFPMLFYSYFISKYKFDGNYLSLFVLMSLLSVFKAFNDSLNLILKSFNKYLLSAISDKTVSIFGRFIAIYFFIEFGFEAYIYTIILIPLIISIPIVFYLKKWIDLSYLKDIKQIKRNIKENKFFTFSAYSRYGIKQLDLLLVSVFLSPEITGTFTFVKRIESIVNGFIANIFDPIMQKTIKYKNDLNKWKLKLRYAIKIQKIVFIISMIAFFISIFCIDFIIAKLGLINYPNIKIFILSMLLAEIIVIVYKVRYSMIMLYLSPKENFKNAIFTSIFIISSFIVFAFLPNEYLYIYSVFGNILVAIYVYIKTKSLFKDKGLKIDY